MKGARRTSQATDRTRYPDRERWPRAERAPTTGAGSGDPHGDQAEDGDVTRAGDHAAAAVEHQPGGRLVDVQPSGADQGGRETSGDGDAESEDGGPLEQGAARLGCTDGFTGRRASGGLLTAVVLELP